MALASPSRRNASWNSQVRRPASWLSVVSRDSSPYGSSTGGRQDMISSASTVPTRSRSSVKSTQILRWESYDSTTTRSAGVSSGSPAAPSDRGATDCSLHPRRAPAGPLGERHYGARTSGATCSTSCDGCSGCCSTSCAAGFGSAPEAAGRPLEVRVELDAVGRVEVDALHLAAQPLALGERCHHLQAVAEDHPVLTSWRRVGRTRSSRRHPAGR